MGTNHTHPHLLGFSPVAGIQWVETIGVGYYCRHCVAGFSPVAGIQWVETWDVVLRSKFCKFQSRCRDSVG